MSKDNILSQMPMDLGDNLKLRFATSDDTDALAEFNARLHEAENAGPGVRDLMSGDHPTCKAGDFTVVEDTKTGKIVSSLLVMRMELKPGVGYLNLIPSLLRALWKKAETTPITPESDNTKVTGIQFMLGREHSVYSVLPKSIVRKEPPYAWYIRVPNLTAFLQHIQPALERHLIGTVAEGYTGDLKLSFYRSGIYLKFREGCLTEIKDWTPENIEDGDAAFPDLTFLQLLCGRCRTAELTARFVDCWANDTAGVLLDRLFPAFTSEVWHL